MGLEWAQIIVFRSNMMFRSGRWEQIWLAAAIIGLPGSFQFSCLSLDEKGDRHQTRKATTEFASDCRMLFLFNLELQTHSRNLYCARHQWEVLLAG